MTQENKDLHTPGSKDDEGKDTPGLLLRDFPNAIRMVSRVAALGAKKYSESGWKEVPFARKRYLDAMMRHQLEIEMGNQIDQETRAPHSAHVAWNALALAQIDAERFKFYGRSFDFDYGGIPTREWDAHPTAQAAWDDAVERKRVRDIEAEHAKANPDDVMNVDPALALKYARQHWRSCLAREAKGENVWSGPTPKSITNTACIEKYVCLTKGPTAWRVFRSTWAGMEKMYGGEVGGSEHAAPEVRVDFGETLASASGEPAVAPTSEAVRHFRAEFIRDRGRHLPPLDETSVAHCLRRIAHHREAYEDAHGRYWYVVSYEEFLTLVKTPPTDSSIAGRDFYHDPLTNTRFCDTHGMIMLVTLAAAEGKGWIGGA
jgi:hypothetical protein